MNIRRTAVIFSDCVPELPSRLLPSSEWTGGSSDSIWAGGCAPGCSNVRPLWHWTIWEGAWEFDESA